jgi:hypothetical protein
MCVAASVEVAYFFPFEKRAVVCALEVCASFTFGVTSGLAFKNPI